MDKRFIKSVKHPAGLNTHTHTHTHTHATACIYIIKRYLQKCLFIFNKIGGDKHLDLSRDNYAC